MVFATMWWVAPCPAFSKLCNGTAPANCRTRDRALLSLERNLNDCQRPPVIGQTATFSAVRAALVVTVMKFC